MALRCQRVGAVHSGIGGFSCCAIPRDANDDPGTRELNVAIEKAE